MAERSRSRFFDRATLAFIVLFNIKAIFSILLLAIHAYLNFLLDSERNLERKQELKEEAAQVYLMLVRIGVNFRPFGLTAIHVYSFYVFMPILFHLSTIIILKRLVQLENNPFYLFIRDYERSESCLKNEISLCLDDMIKSHSNYRINSKEIRRSSSVASQSFGSHQLRRLSRPNKPFEGYSLSPGALRLRNDHQSVIQIKQVERQELHLRWLTEQNQHYSDTLPEYRTKEWRERLIRIGCNSHMFAMSSFTIVGFGLIMGTHEMALKALEADKSLPQELRRFSLADRISCVEQFFYSTIVADLFVSPFSLVATNVLHQLKYLNLLRAKFKTYFRCVQARLLSSRHREGFSCDEEALELYLDWVLFIRLLKGNLKWIGYSMSQFVVCTLGTTYTMLDIVLALSVSNSGVKLATVASVVSVLMVNTYLCFCAAFHAECVRLSKRGWSVVASLLEGQPNQKLMMTGLRQDLASGHTILLWRRIVADTDSILDWFSCRLFYSLTANYSNILRLNFWLISMLILRMSRE